MTEYDLTALCVPLPEDVQKCKLAGDLEGAKRLIERRLKDEWLGERLKKRLALEKLALERLPGEYPLSRAQAMAQLREEIPDFTEAEFDALEEAGWIDFYYIEGEKRYFCAFCASLLVAHPEIAARAGKPLGAKRGVLDECMDAMREKGEASCRTRVRASLRLKDEAFIPGETYRVHLPVPKNGVQVTGAKVLRVSPAEFAHVNGEDAPQRTVYFEAKLDENRPFEVEYELTNRVLYADTEHSERCEGHLYEAPEPTADDLRELPPHVRFTPYLRALAEELAGGETRPLEKARRFYDYVTRAVNYAYLRSYFLYENLAEYVAVNRRGDCGAQSLLFIALCRIAGIPARWQSGMYAGAGDSQAGSHDWAMFYAEPFGWLFADCSFGGGGREEKRRFYFGNLDPFRVAANDAYGAPMQPPCRFLRDDPFDNQSGECECGRCGFTARDWTVSREILESEKDF